MSDWSAIELPEFERAVRDRLGINSALYLPLLRNGECIGLLVVAGKRANAFGEKDVALAEAFRDQALIAIENTPLFDEVQAKTRDLEETLQQQTATADVLKVISRSVFELQTVLDTLVGSAHQLCNANLGLLYLKGDEAFECKAIAGSGVEEASAHFKGRPIRAGRATAAERVILTGEVESVTDFFADPEFDPVAREMIRNAGASGLGLLRSTLAVPMMRNGAVIGVLVIGSPHTGRFPQRQIDLLRTFADQAVIAIENARLFDETQEALERQTATADILKVIASSPSDVQPVFEAIAASANRLIGGFSTAVHLLVGDTVHLASFTPTNPESDQALKAAFPVHRSEVTAVELVANGSTAQIADAETGDAQTRRLSRARGWRSVTFTPLMNRGTFIGFIACTR
ncbi:MAG TPA: GAF domain-containing protein, partial [Bradyrhizobium sp.]|nr:GAF domain-containing protein [Bradyrhizobium sp.]